MREFCGLKRNSESLPFTALLYGMLPKLVPMLEPAFLSRHTAVRSMNPIGTRQVLPSRMKAGAGPSGTASQGFDGRWRRSLRGIDHRRVTGATGGIIGVVLATSPSGLVARKSESVLAFRRGSWPRWRPSRSVFFCSSQGRFQRIDLFLLLGQLRLQS